MSLTICKLQIEFLNLGNLERERSIEYSPLNGRCLRSGAHGLGGVRVPRTNCPVHRTNKKQHPDHYLAESNGRSEHGGQIVACDTLYYKVYTQCKAR